MANISGGSTPHSSGSADAARLWDLVSVAHIGVLARMSNVPASGLFALYTLGRPVEDLARVYLERESDGGELRGGEVAFSAEVAL